MKNILGLDLGTNSIGWAVVSGKNTSSESPEDQLMKIEAAGCRIIPMDAQEQSDYETGKLVSSTAQRRGFRSARRLISRPTERRSRLNRVLNILGFLPAHYAEQLDKYGNFISDKAPKLAWRKGINGGFEFLFMDSYNEMLADFDKYHPHLIANDKMIPHDWTIFYLRKKALTKKISKEELSWLLHNFLQKRGCFWQRGEEAQLTEENSDKKEYFLPIKVISVENSGDKTGDETWFKYHLENGWIYPRKSKEPYDWVDKVKDFIVREEIEKDGTIKKDKYGDDKRKLSIPKEDDWNLRKKKTEADIEKSKVTLGCYIYDSLLNNLDAKIRGELIRTIERKYYRDELIEILKVQKNLHSELSDEDLYSQCINALYKSNEAYRNSISRKGFNYLLIDDIIFYQRPIKSKKSLISDCPFEKVIYKVETDGIVEWKEKSLKCVPKSNPYFQEFRLWQFISNLKIIQKEKVVDNKIKNEVDVTNDFLKAEEDYTNLFEYLNDKDEISQDILFKFFFQNKKSKEQLDYKWNYVEDKSYPGNKTRAIILSKLNSEEKKERKLTRQLEQDIWHMLYSITNQKEIDSLFSKDKTHQKDGIYDKLHNVFSNETIDKIKNINLKEKSYSAFSEKAIKKLLPLMRMGDYWKKENIDSNTLERIEHIITGEEDLSIDSKLRERFSQSNICEEDFKGLPLWIASYVVYGRHSEAKDIDKWASPEDIDKYIANFKQHSLRNPVVEKVIMETLKTVRDIWKQVGHIDEIHVELARSMKQDNDGRLKDTIKSIENENTNQRIKLLLQEFSKREFEISNVLPYSPAQAEILKIYEDGAFNSQVRYDNRLDSFVDDKEIPQDIISIRKKFSEKDTSKQPSHNDVIRYKLWLEQKYRSPYTGRLIPISKLFTKAYEIEHIIPQSRYFDNSFSNKVICESEVNSLKDNKLAMEFIKNPGQRKVSIGINGSGGFVEILSEEAYRELVNKDFATTDSRIKRKKLLMDEIPDDFISSQLNDSRYISKFIKTLLSNIVRVKDEKGNYEPEAISKNVIASTGAITDILKSDWGVKDKWNNILLPRFEEMNKKDSPIYTFINKNGNEVPTVPLEMQKGFNLKRIDHRHHAMDAIVIACTTRSHINLLNNESAKSGNYPMRRTLSMKLRSYEKRMIKGKERDVPVAFFKPWVTFPVDVQNALSEIVVSFKQNLRAISATSNFSQYINEEGKKKLKRQEKGDNIAIRKSLHKQTVSGRVNLRKIKNVKLSEALLDPQRIVNKDLKKKIKELLTMNYDIKKIKSYFDDRKEIWNDINLQSIEVYYFTNETKNLCYATRKNLDETFDEKRIKEKITDTGIQKILLNYLESKNNNPKEAFSPDGIEELNGTISIWNGGKSHKPIIKVRVYETANKFAVGIKDNRSTKFVEAESGTNLYFAVYQTIVVDKKTGEKSKKRDFISVPLNIIIDCQKKNRKNWKDIMDKYLKSEGNMDSDSVLLFTLSPGDLLYIPNQNVQNVNIEDIDKSCIYKVVKFTGKQLYAIPYNVARVIKDGQEFGSQNAVGITTGLQYMLPMEVDRLGNILSIYNEPL